MLAKDLEGKSSGQSQQLLYLGSFPPFLPKKRIEISASTKKQELRGKHPVLRPIYILLKFVLIKPLMTTHCGGVERGVYVFFFFLILGEMCLSNSLHGREENYMMFVHFSFRVSLKEKLPLGLKVKEIKKEDPPHQITACHCIVEALKDVRFPHMVCHL